MDASIDGGASMKVSLPANSQRVALQIDISADRVTRSCRTENNAIHAIAVQRMLQACMSYAALEASLVDLYDIVRLCDAHTIEFDQFVTFNDLLFGPGSTELDRFEEAHELRVAEDDYEPGAGLTTPLEGESGGYIHLLAASTSPAPRPGSVQGSCSLHLAIAVGKYFLLFERPLPALGAFRAAWTRDPEDCAAADGVAHCLCLLGLQEAAAAPLAVRYWQNVHPPLSDAADASSFLATLAHVMGKPPPTAATAILRNAGRFLSTGAVSAARKLLRQWLPAWLGRGGDGGVRCDEACQFFRVASSKLEDADSVDATSGLVGGDTKIADTVACGAGSETTDVGATVLLWELADAGGWLGVAMRGSNLFACAALEPVLRTCRHQLLQCHFAVVSDAPPAVDVVCRATAAASIACHMLAVGFCVPEAHDETQAVSEASIALRSGAAGTRLQEAAASGDAAVVDDLALLMIIAMYRPLSHVVPGMHAFTAAQLSTVPLADEAMDVHLRKPYARARRAEALPRVTPLDDASKHVQAFYSSTLFPMWHVPETGDVPHTTVGASLRRHYPWIEWPFDTEPNPLRVCIAGAGSGHHVAQAALTLSACELVALDLSAASLAYGEAQMASLFPQEASHVSWVVGDLMRLGEGGTESDSRIDLPMHTVECSTSERRFRHPLARQFHLVMCFGVLHHCVDPSVALKRLANTTLPGGVLQLGTYSTFGVRSWRPAARRLLHHISPEVISEAGELLHQPTPAELRAIRARVFQVAEESSAASHGGADAAAHGGGDAAAHKRRSEAASSSADINTGAESAVAWPMEGSHERATANVLSRDCAAAKMLTLFDEFYSHGGALDLLFHPQETTFTLLQVHSMVEEAGLEVIGVFFLSEEADQRARAAFTNAKAGALLKQDPRMCDLRHWHTLEKRDPTLFGRMHVVYCQLKLQ